ncbi:MAG: hypothetical protein ABI870_10715 [Rhodanobacter sp.]
MSSHKRFPLVILSAALFALATGSLCAHAATVTPACKQLIAAMSKPLATPSHV